MASLSDSAGIEPAPIAARLNRWLCRLLGYAVLGLAAAGALSLLTWNSADPSLTLAANGPVRNVLGPVGAIISDLVMQLLGLAGVFIFLPLLFWALQLISAGRLASARFKLMLAPLAVLLLACAASALPAIEAWPLRHSVGGLLGDFFLSGATSVLAMIRSERASAAAGLFCFAGGMLLLMTSLGLSQRDVRLILQRPQGLDLSVVSNAWRRLGEVSERVAAIRREPMLRMPEPTFPQAPAFGPSPRSPFAPEPQPYVPTQPEAPYFGRELRGPVAEDDIDPQELKRIANMCAPERAARAAEIDEPPSILLDHEPARETYPPAPADPMREGRGRAGAMPGPSGQGAAWPSYTPAAPARPSMAPPSGGWRPESLPGGDDLYGRAVAIVLDDRKASAGYLQQRLAIGYMRAADLIERMERDGILGAPVYNGMRPILIDSPGSREV